MGPASDSGRAAPPLHSGGGDTWPSKISSLQLPARFRELAMDSTAATAAIAALASAGAWEGVSIFLAAGDPVPSYDK